MGMMTGPGLVEHPTGIALSLVEDTSMGAAGTNAQVTIRLIGAGLVDRAVYRPGEKIRGHVCANLPKPLVITGKSGCVCIS